MVVVARSWPLLGLVIFTWPWKSQWLRPELLWSAAAGLIVKLVCYGLMGFMPCRNQPHVVFFSYILLRLHLQASRFIILCVILILLVILNFKGVLSEYISYSDVFSKWFRIQVMGFRKCYKVWCFLIFFNCIVLLYGICLCFNSSKNLLPIIYEFVWPLLNDCTFW